MSRWITLLEGWANFHLLLAVVAVVAVVALVVFGGGRIGLDGLLRGAR